MNATFGLNPFFSSAIVKSLAGVINISKVNIDTNAAILEVKTTALKSPSL